MTESEFHALVPNQRVQREGKEFVVVKKETRDVICHPKGQPNFLVHFPPQQAPSMAKIESQPDVLDRPQSSHGFPALERPTPKLPVPHMPGQTQNLVSMALDGGLSECRRGFEIGSPIPGALEFLVSAAKAGIELQVCTDRPQGSVYQWLRVHFPGTEHVVHVTPHPPPPGVPYISQYAYRVGDTYPTSEELSALIHPSEENNAPKIESAFGR